MNVEWIKSLIQQFRELDCYNVDTDSEGFLYVERKPDGNWMNSFSVECIVDELEKELNWILSQER